MQNNINHWSDFARGTYVAASLSSPLIPIAPQGRSAN